MNREELKEEIKSIFNEYKEFNRSFGLKVSKYNKDLEYFFPEYKNSQELKYRIVNDFWESPKCLDCGKETKFRTYKLGFNKYCNSCANKKQTWRKDSKG